jgi:hypothetical protein
MPPFVRTAARGGGPDWRAEPGELRLGGDELLGAAPDGLWVEVVGVVGGAAGSPLPVHAADTKASSATSAAPHHRRRCTAEGSPTVAPLHDRPT